MALKTFTANIPASSRVKINDASELYVHHEASPDLAAKKDSYSLLGFNWNKVRTHLEHTHKISADEVMYLTNVTLVNSKSSTCHGRGELFLFPEPAFRVPCSQSFIGHIHEGDWPHDEGVFSAPFLFALSPPAKPIKGLTNSVDFPRPTDKELEHFAELKRYGGSSKSWYVALPGNRTRVDQMIGPEGEQVTNPLFFFVSKYSPKFLVKQEEKGFPHCEASELTEHTSPGSRIVDTYYLSSSLAQQCTDYIADNLATPNLGRLGFDAFLSTGDSKFTPCVLDMNAYFNVSYAIEKVPVARETVRVMPVPGKTKAAGKK